MLRYIVKSIVQNMSESDEHVLEHLKFEVFDKARTLNIVVLNPTFDSCYDTYYFAGDSHVTKTADFKVV